ncbi:MAG TPA: GAF domain-containing protein, partial [Sulfurovum sp.]|nr:GAF domain-containing protein [Sulfurovum sp.]
MAYQFCVILKRLNKLENKSSELIQILTESMEQVAKASNSVDINTIIETLLMKFTDSDLAVLLLFDSEKQTLYSKNKDFKTLSMVDAKGLLGKAFLSKSASIYNHMASEKHYFQSIDNPGKLKLKSQIIFPIIKDDNLIGIACTSRSITYRTPYTKQELELLSSLDSFLVKIIHILINGMDMKYREKIDTTTINEQIIQTEKSSDNDEN